MIGAEAPDYFPETLIVPTGGAGNPDHLRAVFGADPDRLLVIKPADDSLGNGVEILPAHAVPARLDEIVGVWRTRLDPGHTCGIVHLNPVYDAAGFDVRRLAPGVPTAGIRDAEDLVALAELARFAEGRTGLPALRAHLDRRVAAFLREQT